jgi:Outer membrane protein Omp28/Secretion system C-terminal sorting domain
MKKAITFGICLLAIPLSIFSQNVKKYVLMEHFTNTNCGTCGSINPSFFNVIKVETNKDVHHMTVHPSIPYADCALYQANTAPQDKRSTFYGILGTPRVSVNGAAATSVSNISATTLTTETAKTSPVSIRVTETSGVAGITASITVKAVNDIAAAEYRLFVAVVEKKVNYSGRNSESVHNNVFRKFLTAANGDGDVIAMPAKGAEKTINFNYAAQSPWVADQVYILAFVQNMTTKEILNSGTRFDVVSAVDEPQLDNQVQVSPNPTNGSFNYTFNNLTPQYLTLTNVVGQVVLSKNNEAIVNNDALNLSNQPSGVYYLTIKAKEGFAVKKIVKQ